MAVIRGHHSFDERFTQIPNHWLRDSRLSLKAIGLLAQIMSHTPGWNMSIRSLAKNNNCGTELIKSAIGELEEYGYLRRSEQKHDERGRFVDFDYITQDPTPTQNTVTGKPRHGEMGHKEEHSYIEKQFIKNKQEKDSSFDKFWEIYPKKLDKAKARKAFRSALRVAEAETIIEGARRYANDPNLPEIQFVKYPATWLNAEAWENPPLPARVLTEEEKREQELRRLLEEDGD